MEKLNEIFAKKLRLYRGKRSQQEVAEEFNISQTYLSALEKGKKSPSYDLLCHIIEITGKDISYWFCSDSSSKSEKHLENQAQTIHKSDVMQMTVPEIIALQAQIRVYLDNIQTPIVDYDRRMLSDILAACQRALDHQSSETQNVI